MASVDTKKIVDTINNVFGDDLKNLRKAKEMREEAMLTKTALETSLSSFINPSRSQFSREIRETDNVLGKINKLSEEKEKMETKVAKHLEQIREKIDKLSIPVEDVQHIEKYSSYLQWINHIEGICIDIETAVAVQSYQRAVSSYKNLVTLSEAISMSACVNLVTYVNDTTEFWYSILKSNITEEFESVTKHLKWPILTVASSTEPSTLTVGEARSQLDTVITLLLNLQKPLSKSEIDEPEMLLPLQLLLNPLRKRFLFHFCGSKQTNNIEKPEWYLTQVISWIKSNVPFLEAIVQPIFDRGGHSNVNVRVEFMKGLVQLITDKMTNDLPRITYNEQLLSHSIDELLLFDKEIKGLRYPSGLPSCLMVLTESHCFPRWIHMERQYATDKMDAILASPTVWNLQYGDQGDVDEMRVTECAESFMMLLLTITERYKVLAGAAHRLQFLNLQLELIDDMRVRLLQLLKSEPSDSTTDSHYCAILNTVEYITVVMKEWSDLPFFLQLQYYRLQFESLQMSLSLRKKNKMENNQREVDQAGDAVESIDLVQDNITSLQDEALSSLEEDFSDDKIDYIVGTVFSDILSLMDRMVTDMEGVLVEHVMFEVQARSMSYRKEKWFSLPLPNKLTGGGNMSSSGCPMLSVLKYHLHSLHNQLAVPLFLNVWQSIAKKLNTFLFNEVILVNKFSEGGAAQLNIDVTRNIFPIFGEFTQKPAIYFKETKESCTLLTLKPATALLLREVLESGDDKNGINEPVDVKQALSEQGISKLSPEQALTILGIRTDLAMF